MVVECLRTHKEECWNSAVNLGGVNKFIAKYNKVATMVMKHDGGINVDLLQKIIRQLQEVQQSINEDALPYYQDLYYIASYLSPSESQSESQKQYINKLVILEEIYNDIDSNIEKLSHVNARSVIYVNQLKSLQEKFADRLLSGDLNEDDLFAFNLEGLSGLYEFEFYTIPPKPKNWWGTIISGILGVVQIAVGISITMATGGALGNFGIGMAASGVMDIYNSIESVINNAPIDLDQYFKSKTIEYAVRIGTLGIDVASSTPLTTAEGMNGMTAFGGAVNQAITAKMIDVATTALAKDLFSDHKEDVHDKIAKKINDMLASLNNEWNIMMSRDKLDESDYWGHLQQHSTYVLRKFYDRYHKDIDMIATGIASHYATGVARMGLRAAEITKQIEQIDKMAGSIANAIGKEIKIQASGAVTERTIFEHHTGISSDANKQDMMAQLDAAGIFDPNGNIIDSAITQISTMSFKGITIANVQKALHKIYDTTHADYSSKAGEYGASIIKQIQGQVNGNIVSLTGSVAPVEKFYQ